MSILNGVKLLSSLSETEKEKFGVFCQEKHLSKGDVLFKESEEASAMYFLVDGEIEVSRYIEGEEVIIGKVYSEEILGEMALFGDTNKRMATAIALTDCRLIVILSFSIKELTSTYPDLLNKIKVIINDRLVHNKDKGFSFIKNNFIDL